MKISRTTLPSAEQVGKLLRRINGYVEPIKIVIVPLTVKHNLDLVEGKQRLNYCAVVALYPQRPFSLPQSCGFRSEGAQHSGE
jgi:hypothetical protein